MNIESATEILKVLANGINPITGELLSLDDSCNQPEVIRALYRILRELRDVKTNKNDLPENAGKPWTEFDDYTLCKMYDEGKSVKELSEYFKRTSGAITSRLKLLGKIDK